MKITLKTGFKRHLNNEDVQVKDVELKILSYGEMLDIQEQSEKLMYTNSGQPILVASETKLAKLSLVGQIKKIGDEFGPFGESILDDLTEEDGIYLMNSIEMLNTAGVQAQNMGKE